MCSVVHVSNSATVVESASTNCLDCPAGRYHTGTMTRAAIVTALFFATFPPRAGVLSRAEVRLPRTEVQSPRAEMLRHPRERRHYTTACRKGLPTIGARCCRTTR